MTDPIADLLTRIRNGQMANKDFIVVPFSGLKKNILDILLQKSFIKGYKENNSGKFKQLEVELDLSQEISLKRVSKPGQRIYLGKDEIKKVLSGYGISIMSTSKGVMSGDDAKKQGVGGELLCEVF